MKIPGTLTDPLLREAYEHAAQKSVLAALNPRAYFGYFSVTADGVDFGGNCTYPGLDWGQSGDALLWLGRVAEVRASWDYVRTFQNAEGQLPLAILPDERGRTLQVLGHSMTVADNGGLYRHWCPGDPLRALATVTFIEMANTIYRHTNDREWLSAQIPYVQRAVRWLESLTDANGQVAGAAFYLERPTRIEFEGVTQCAVAHALQLAAGLCEAVGETAGASADRSLSKKTAIHFQQSFWVGDHFAEYVHPQRGCISHHGLTDVDWAAIAFGIASPEQVNALWPRLRSEPRFYYGGMPTGIATHPESYEDWEFPGADRHDLAAMGRVWYLECWARWRMGDHDGILDSLRRVAASGKANDWYWRERYYPDGKPAGARKYCEYPANFIRIVHRFLATH